PYATSELRDAHFANVEHAFISTNASNPTSQQHRFSDLFVIDEASTFNTLDAANAAPIAAFGSTSAEGLAVVLDAAASFDADPSPEVRAIDDGIAAYAWDVDGDGRYDDAYGRSLTVNFDSPGEYRLGLMVWDDDGATATTTQSVVALEQPYANPWVDGDFSSAGPLEGQFYRFVSGRRGDGWIARDVQRNAAGFAEIAAPQFGLGSLGQIVRDQYVRRGEQAFAFDAIATDGLGQANLLQVRLFGVNGQFDLDEQGAPSAIHAMAPPEVMTLVDVNVALNQISDWQTHSFNVNLGADGYEYLVVAVQYAGYNVAQGDYFALDNFSLLARPERTALSTGSVPLPALFLAPPAQQGPHLAAANRRMPTQPYGPVPRNNAHRTSAEIDRETAITSAKRVDADRHEALRVASGRDDFVQELDAAFATQFRLVF
ncbi:MAG: PKD domain-containing protein, partial [Planctomycetota bacterium]